MARMKNAVKLNDASLPLLDPEIRTPQFERGVLRQHTVHIGVGGFHRAHQAVYLDDLLEQPDTERWGECGMGVLPTDDHMRDALGSQNCLYTVVERSAQGNSARVIGSLIEYVYAPGNIENALEKLAAPDTRIVSLTITEGGYFIDEATGDFVQSHPAIQHDLLKPKQPTSSLGLLAEALDRRRQRGLPPFTVMSCDNLQGNGHVLRKVLLAYAGLRNVELQRWIADNVSFPNSMVDRITPATKPADLSFVADTFGIEDAWPVVTEPFRQWVIEDNFCNGRPQWERVGVQLVEDVAPYEIMKMRLLNGSHLAMAYFGALSGFTYVHEIMDDLLFREFIASFMDEVTPIVPLIPGTSVPEYKQTLIQRFSNPTINDQVTRICSEGSAKMPKWLLPSIGELLAQGDSAKLLTLVVASWILYFARGTDEDGRPIEIVDARAQELITIASSGGNDARAMLSIKTIFGEQLTTNQRWMEDVGDALRTLATMGVRSTLQRYLSRAQALS